jgi:hypothetical protein
VKTRRADPVSTNPWDCSISITCENRESILVAGSSHEFAAQALRLLGDAEERERLGATARLVAEATIGWIVLGRRLRAIISQVARGADTE